MIACHGDAAALVRVDVVLSVRRTLLKHLRMACADLLMQSWISSSDGYTHREEKAFRHSVSETSQVARASVTASRPDPTGRVSVPYRVCWWRARE